MRVDDRNLAGSQAARSGLTNQAEQVERLSDARTPDSRPAWSADRVELSDLTGDLARALEAARRDQAGRVERLAEELASGRYQVDARAVSRAIVAEMRTAGGPPEGF